MKRSPVIWVIWVALAVLGSVTWLRSDALWPAFARGVLASGSRPILIWAVISGATFLIVGGAFLFGRPIAWVFSRGKLLGALLALWSSHAGVAFYTIVHIRGFHYGNYNETQAWVEQCEWTLFFHGTYLMLASTLACIMITVSLAVAHAGHGNGHPVER